MTADADGSSVALAGGLIPVGGCSVRVDVRSIVAGPITNTMPPGAVQSENAPPSIETAVAQIQSEMPIPTLSTGFLVLLGLLVAAAGSRLLVRGA